MRIRHWIVWGLLVFFILGIGGVAFGFHAAGYEKYIVQTGSMVPKLDPGDLVIDKPASAGYQVGDIITFRHGQGSDLVTHRIVDITPDGIKTKGDANRTADVWTIPPDFVQGVVAFTIPKGGYVVLFVSQPAGLGAVALALVGLIFLWRLFFPAEPPHNEAEFVDTTDGNDSGIDNDSQWAPKADDAGSTTHNDVLGTSADSANAFDPDFEALGRHATVGGEQLTPSEQPISADRDV